METPAKRARKQTSGRDFKNWWTDRYGMVYDDEQNKAFCVLCSGTVVCRTSSVKRHYRLNHKWLLEKTEEEQKAFISHAVSERDNNPACDLTNTPNSFTGAASFIASKFIAKHGRPYADGEFIKKAWLETASMLFGDFKNKDQIIQRIKDLPLSRSTVKDRILIIAANVVEHQINDIISSRFISVCLVELSDAVGSPLLAVFVRYFMGNIVREEMIQLSPLPEDCKGKDICKTVVDALSEKNIDLSKIVSVTTDGTPIMTAKESGFVDLFQAEVGHPLIGFHCIINEKVLDLSGFKYFDDTITLVTKIVNKISTHASDREKQETFEALLEEVKSVYNGDFIRKNTQWLIRGKVLQRFTDCLLDVRLFFTNDNRVQRYSELTDVKWLAKLFFFTDLCEHVNEFNLQLQGNNKTIVIMMDLIKAFDAKLQLFKKDILSNSFKYFPKLKKHFNSSDTRDKLKTIQSTVQFSSVIKSLINEFQSRFAEFQELSETLKFIIYPDATPGEQLAVKRLEWLYLEELQMQLIEFQTSSMWSQKFVDLRKDLEAAEIARLSNATNVNVNVESKIISTWFSLPDSFFCLKRLAQAFMTIFFSTHACEMLHSQINSSATTHPEKCMLSLTNYEPDLKSLASDMERQKHH